MELANHDLRADGPTVVVMTTLLVPAVVMAAIVVVVAMFLLDDHHLAGFRGRSHGRDRKAKSRDGSECKDDVAHTMFSSGSTSRQRTRADLVPNFFLNSCL
jgi:hypothetical protein